MPKPILRPTRTKLDPRLAMLASLTPAKLAALCAQEGKALESIAQRLATIPPKSEDAASSKALKEIREQLFAPLTAGIHLAQPAIKSKAWPVSIAETFASVLILSDASAKDLSELGARIRSQAGDIFTAFVPLSALPKLEASPYVRYIELARPLERTLDDAVPYAQIDTLHSAASAITGAGVIVGVVDSALDIYHSDFRTNTDATRVLFLWVQGNRPQGTEAGPPIAPALPGFTPQGGATYGVEYNQATIDTELANFNPPATPAYRTVRHRPSYNPNNPEHGTHVAGIAAGNGRGQAGAFTGAAPDAEIIFVAQAGIAGTALFADTASTLDAFAYIMARAEQLGRPCSINMSASDNQGPHDGTTLGEQFLDNLLLTPGRVITLSAGNSTGTRAHASGVITQGTTSNLVLNYQQLFDNAGNPIQHQSDDVEIWYDGHDRVDITLTAPDGTSLGPVTPGNSTSSVISGVTVNISSQLNDQRNGDNLISVIFTVPDGRNLIGNWTFALTGSTIINGSFHAWVDRNNRLASAWQAPFLDETQLTLGVPATARRAITVGNHTKAGPPPGIRGSSGRGPTRDGRIKPEITACGTDVNAPLGCDMTAANPDINAYATTSGTSMSAPMVAGACALLFQGRGAGLNWADMKLILQDTAGTAGLAVPGNTFGFGFLQMGNAMALPAPAVDVWLRDDANDTGQEPFIGPVAWRSPDIEVLDDAGNPVPNPTYDPVKRFSNRVRVTVRNRGTSTARNTEVYLYWADPGTNIPFPSAWDSRGIYTGAPNFTNHANMIVVPQLAPGASTQVEFAWAPPAPGSNLRGDNHFCLLARLENESDPSQLGSGGWPVIRARNNIALRNLHVQPDDGGDNDFNFFATGSADVDSLIFVRELLEGKVEIQLPARLLTLRDPKVLDKIGPRQPLRGKLDLDPFARLSYKLANKDIQPRTDITGAATFEIRDGIARLTMAEGARLVIPRLHLAEGAKVPVKVHLSGAKTKKESKYIHVSQLSGGVLVGGV